jgi:membrane protein DedA with SNARE-associated domain
MSESLATAFQNLLEFVDSIPPLYAYLVLFGVAFLENLFPPFPGDTFTIIGGYLCAVGKLDLGPTFLAVILGTMLSVMGLYYLGRKLGRPFFKTRNWVFPHSSDIDRAERLFARYGILTLLFSRFVVGVRVAIAFGAGMTRYPAGKTAVYSTISAALFQGTLIALAFLLHAYVLHVKKGFDLYATIVLVVVAVILILVFAFVLRRVIRRARKRA